MLLSNQTQLLPTMTAPEDAVTRLVTASSSSYALPTPVLATAADGGTFEQTFVHTGVEHVVQSPSYTITAGGIPTEATASIMGFSGDSDYGVAMPTTIIPTFAGSALDDIFRFDGGSVDEFKPVIGRNREANTCVAAGFACGIWPWMGKAFATCTQTLSIPGDVTAFVNSSKCLPDAKSAFWLAARLVDCHGSFSPRGSNGA